MITFQNLLPVFGGVRNTNISLTWSISSNWSLEVPPCWIPVSPFMDGIKYQNAYIPVSCIPPRLTSSRDAALMTPHTSSSLNDYSMAVQ